EDARIDGGAARGRSPGANAIVQDGKVQPQGETPDGAGGVVGLEEVVDKDGGKQLRAVGGAQPGWEGKVGGRLGGDSTGGRRQGLGRRSQPRRVSRLARCERAHYHLLLGGGVGASRSPPPGLSFHSTPPIFS